MLSDARTHHLPSAAALFQLRLAPTLVIRTLLPAAEYVKERIIALRKQHPGQYQNASVVRAPAAGCRLGRQALACRRLLLPRLPRAAAAMHLPS